MNPRILVLPTLCLGGAALLLAPARPSQAFSKIGGLLNDTQRDVRVFDNFLDAQANNNVASPVQFPGWTGAELAVWKGVVEWGSLLHGDGTGDPQNGNLLGNAGANFDAFWAGNAAAIGTANSNIVSSLSSCGGGGTLAFTETPISDGWRIRFCDEWVWEDGPGAIGQWDIQGVMCHEYGHALGLGHSTTGQATMAPSGSPGQTGIRSIHSDDIAGIQCIYGVASGTKPTIFATVANTGANTLTIYGTNFDPTNNEVWFTNSTMTASGADPIVRVLSVISSGGNTIITVTIPADASPGDVIVNKPGTGGSTLSNAFPTDLVGTFGTPPAGPHPDITNVTPSTIDALIPGTAETITITGTDLDLVTSLTLDGNGIPLANYTIVNPTTITLDMPQAAGLGLRSLGASDGIETDLFSVTVAANASPTLQWGTGDALNVVDRDNGLDMILAGPVGSLQLVRGSPHALPNLMRYLAFPGRPLVDGGAHVIPASGWIAVHLEGLPDPAIAGSTWFARSFEVPLPFTQSNDQSITLVP